MGIIITILVITGVIVETILIGNTLVTLRMIDNEQECDKQFWESENGFKNNRKNALCKNEPSKDQR